LSEFTRRIFRIARPIVRINRMRDPPRITHPCELSSRGDICPATVGRDEGRRGALFLFNKETVSFKDTVSR